ncbi:FCD domain-containing protein [Alcanivorax sp. IO_7]|nr:FCD domain-containing protein [Alcanivorax sp. IO_7]
MSFAYLEQRDRFYGVMIDIGGNQELPRMLPATMVQLLRLQFQSYDQFTNPPRRFREYQVMGEAILAGDSKRAERCTRLHIRSSRLAIQNLPDAAFFNSGGR